MNALNLLIGGLAVWRISHAIVKEHGPLMIFVRLRAFAASHQKRSGGFFDMLSCVYCTSFWIALLACLYNATDAFHWIGYALAISAVACLIEILSNKFDTFTVVTNPTRNYQIPVGVSSTPKKGNDVVGDPSTPDRTVAVET